MPPNYSRLSIVSALVLTACGLSGCGTINSHLAAGAGDYIPQWAGGLPAGAPPRPGSAKYDEYMQERERNRLLPRPAKQDEGKDAPSSSDAIH
jgi:uncharacterized protein YceK